MFLWHLSSQIKKFLCQSPNEPTAGKCFYSVPYNREALFLCPFGRLSSWDFGLLVVSCVLAVVFIVGPVVAEKLAKTRERERETNI